MIISIDIRVKSIEAKKKPTPHLKAVGIAPGFNEKAIAPTPAELSANVDFSQSIN
jgi:hypothetical protein